MKELLKYLNGLDKAAQADYAQRCKTTVGYLRKACSTGQVIREIVCSRLDVESDGVVKRRHLRPNDWHVIWPELVDPAAASKIEPNQPMAPVQRTQAAIETIANVIEATDRASWAVVKHQNACAESAAVAGQGF